MNVNTTLQNDELQLSSCFRVLKNKQKHFTQTMACDVQNKDPHNDSYESLLRETERLKSKLEEEKAKLNDKDGMFFWS